MPRAHLPFRVWVPAAIAAATFLCVPSLRAAAASPGDGTWELLSGPVDPPAGYRPHAVHDPVRHRLVLLDDAYPSRIWVLPLVPAGNPVWQRISVPGPAPRPRWQGSVVYDPLGDRLLLFGGSYRDAWYLDPMPHITNEVWSLELDGTPRWHPVSTIGDGPAPREQSAAAFDPGRNRMIVFGGAPFYSDLPAGERLPFDDAWALDLSSSPAQWTPLDPVGPRPAPRSGAVALFDRWNDRMLVYAGYTQRPGGGSGYLGDLWSLSFSAGPRWDSVAVANAPGARTQFTFAIDPVEPRAILNGGFAWPPQPDPLVDTWMLSLGPTLAWSRFATSGEIPGLVVNSTAIVSPERGSLVHLSLRPNRGPMETAELELESGTWAKIPPPTPAVVPPRNATSTLMPAEPGGALLAWVVGNPDSTPFTGLWEFRPGDPGGWSFLESDAMPPRLWQRAFVYDPERRRVLLFDGGYFPLPGGSFGGVWALPLDGPRAWTRLVTHGPPPEARWDFSLMHDPGRDRVLLFGGTRYRTRSQDNFDDFDDVWSFSLDAHAWTRLPTAGTPGARREHSTVYDPLRDRMLVIAGAYSVFRGSKARQDCWALSLSTDPPLWSRLGADAPLVGLEPLDRAVLDAARDRVLAWTEDARVWELPLSDTAAWRPLEPSGTPPTERWQSAITFDDRNDALVLLGGCAVPGDFVGWVLTGDLQRLRFSRRVEVELLRGPARESGELARGRGSRVLEVAVLAAPDFSPDSVLVETATLAHARALGPGDRDVSAPSLRIHPGDGRRWGATRDVNRDGLPDLVLRFDADALRLGRFDSAAVLLARTPSFEILGRVDLRRQPTHARGAAPLSAVGAGDGLRLAVNSPISGVVTIRFGLPARAPARLEVFDLAGRRVEERSLSNLETGEHRLALHGGWPAGLYLVRLSQAGRSVTARIVVLR